MLLVPMHELFTVYRLSKEKPSVIRRIVEYVKNLMQRSDDAKLNEQLKAMTDKAEELIGEVKAEDFKARNDNTKSLKKSKEYKTDGLSKRERAILGHEVVRQNALLKNESDIIVNGAFTDSKFHIYETWGDDTFEVIKSIPIEGNEDFIKSMQAVIRKGLNADEPFSTSELIDSIDANVRTRRKSNTGSRVDAAGGRTNRDISKVDRQKSTSKSNGYSSESGRNQSRINSADDSEPPQRGSFNAEKAKRSQVRIPEHVVDSNSKVTKEANEVYTEAVKSGDKETAKGIVREIASKVPAIAKDEHGNPIPLYHGTRFFGFTRFADPNHEVPFIYTSTDRTVSAHYAVDNNYAGVREIGKKYRERDSVEVIIANAKTVWNSDYKRMTAGDKEAVYKETENEASEIADRIDELKGKVEDFGERIEWDEKTDSAVAWMENLFYTVRDWDVRYNFKEDDGARSVFRDELAHDLDQYKKSRETVYEYLSNNRKALGNAEKEYLSYLCGYNVGDAAIDIESRMLRVATEDDLITNGHGIQNPFDLKKALDEAHNIGAYELYGDLGERPFEFDADGAQFWALKVPEVGEGFHDTDTVVKWAQENGYTSVIMHNIYDYGDKADNYVFFNSKQLKSADPVTYDDAGKAIPLSERFDTSKPDIRFSIEKRVADENGNVHENAVKSDTRLFDERFRFVSATAV